MRFIRKGNGELYFLEQANQNLPQTSEQANSRWNSFSSDYKRTLTTTLKDEQYGLCAYSEICIENNNLGTHIEHIEPKSDNPQRTFDYQNLVVSALNSEDLKRRNKEDIFGGHARKNTNFVNFISPLQDNCFEYFIYTSDGRVSPSESLSEEDKMKANYTINELNLNCDYLITERKKWLDELDAYIDEHIDNHYCSLKDLAAIYLAPVNTQLHPFFTANRQRFGAIGEQTLAHDVPELT